MASYLVMKNNIKRLGMKKSTYLIMLLVPLLLSVVGSAGSRIGEQSVRVGIVGELSFQEKVKTVFTEQNGILFAAADENSINTDKIMGKYHYILDEKQAKEEQNNILIQIREAGKESAAVNKLPTEKRMTAMLLTVYMTAATIYGMKYLRDKKDGIIQRFAVAGCKKVNYITGYFLSNCVITGIQMVVIFLLWCFFDKAFSVPLFTLGQIYFFILIVSNVYAMFIIVISKTELMAGVLGASVAVLLSVLGGTFVAVEHMPAVLQKISVISPVNWLLQMF